MMGASVGRSKPRNAHSDACLSALQLGNISAMAAPMVAIENIFTVISFFSDYKFNVFPLQ
jgi:hypothetical protein